MTWENLFVGIDSGKVDLVFSNITDTEERKKKYEFASYRKDNLAFEVPKDEHLELRRRLPEPRGKTVAVGAGTNQEKILLEWQAKLAKRGQEAHRQVLPGEQQHLPGAEQREDRRLLRPEPRLAYHTTQTAKTPNPTRIAGKFSGAGESLQGLIAATAKKDSGLAKPLADAINHLIKNGQYAKWLAAWNLSNEAVTKSEVNPPGLPTDNS